MSDTNDKPKKLWTDTCIENAKGSALPALAEPIAEHMGLDVEDVVDAIGASLLSLTAEEADRDETTRAALKPIVHDYAETIGMKWEEVADAIIGALHWTKPDSKNWAMPDWK